jgi:hypothetical protein
VLVEEVGIAAFLVIGTTVVDAELVNLVADKFGKVEVVTGTVATDA